MPGRTVLTRSFNPRSRAGSDCQQYDDWPCYPVSIHAPVRGATPEARCNINGGAVSIHAPVRGATRQVRVARRRLAVSIHAPVRGATHRLRADRLAVCGFNPRSRAGSDGQR